MAIDLQVPPQGAISGNGKAPGVKLPEDGRLIDGKQITASTLAELIEPEPAEVYDTVSKMRDDYQVTFAEAVINGLLSSVVVTVRSESQEGNEISDTRADALVRKLQELWDNTRPSMYESVPFGRVAYEKVWDYDPLGTVNFCRKLAALPFQYTEMLLDQEGAFAGIRLDPKKEKDVPAVDLSCDKAWWLSLDATEIQPHGQSKFLKAPYVTWKYRQKLVKIRNLYCEKFLVDGGTVFAPPTETDDRGHTINVFAEIFKAYEQKKAGGIWAFPNRRDASGNRLYEYQEGGVVKDPSALNATLGVEDIEQLRAFMIPEKTVIEGAAVGSFAMVSLQMLVLYSVIEEIMRQLVNSFNKYVCDKSADLNWYPDDPYKPKIYATYKPLTDRNDALVIELVKLVLTAPNVPPAIVAGLVDLPQMLRDSGLPVGPGIDDKIAELIAKAGFAAPGGPSAAPEPGGYPGSPDVPEGPQGPASGLPGDSSQTGANAAAVGDLSGGKYTSPISPTSLNRLLRLAERVNNRRLPLKTAQHLAALACPDVPASERNRVLFSSRKQPQQRAAGPPGNLSQGVPKEGTRFDLLTEGGSRPFDLALNGKDRPPVQGLPRPDVLAERFQVFMGRLYGDLQKELLRLREGNGSRDKIRTLLKQINSLQRDSVVGSFLLGLLSPWSAKVQPIPEGKAPVTSKLPKWVKLALQPFGLIRDLADPYATFQSPGEDPQRALSLLDNAASWLEDKGLANLEDYRSLVQKTRTDPVLPVDEALEKLHSEVYSSVLEGESVSQFQSRISGLLDAPRNKTATLIRTQTKQAYNQGLDKITANKVVRKATGYYLFSATPDPRVRDHHWDMDGVVVSMDDSGSVSYLRKILDEYSCRCALSPIGYDEAARRGLSSIVGGIAVPLPMPPKEIPPPEAPKEPAPEPTPEVKAPKGGTSEDIGGGVVKLTSKTGKVSYKVPGVKVKAVIQDEATAKHIAATFGKGPPVSDQPPIPPKPVSKAEDELQKIGGGLFKSAKPKDIPKGAGVLEQDVGDGIVRLKKGNKVAYKTPDGQVWGHETTAKTWLASKAKYQAEQASVKIPGTGPGSGRKGAPAPEPEPERVPTVKYVDPFPSGPNLKEVKPLGGSTGAVLVEDQKGKQWVRKTGIVQGHVAEEFAAEEAYRALGVNVPDSKLYVTGEGPVKLSAFIEGGRPLSALKGKEREDAIRKVQQGFAADALLANWDVVGLEEDNILVDSKGEIWRVDVGGALRRRAQGESKGDAWNGQANELRTLLDPDVNAETAGVFKGITDEEILGQIQSLKAHEKQLLASLPPELHKTLHVRLVNMETTIKDRIDAKKPPPAPPPLVTSAKVVAPGVTKFVKEGKVIFQTPDGEEWGDVKEATDWYRDDYLPTVKEAEKLGKPAPGQFTPVKPKKILPTEFTKLPPSDNRLRKEKVIYNSATKVLTERTAALPRDQIDALDDYTGIAYSDINAALREANGDIDKAKLSEFSYQKEVYAREMRLIHQATKAPLPEPVTVYRGETFSPTAQDQSRKAALLSLKPGDELKSKQFWSTSLNPAAAAGFTQKGQIVFEIRAKTGVYISEIGDNSIEDEREILQNVGTRYRVVQVIPDASVASYEEKQGIGVTIIQLEEL